MINMMAKAQKSWIAKLILGLTALSFMSLFGISGYLRSVGKNRPVIKVDNIELKKSEFDYMLQQEQDKVRKLMGDEYLDNENVQNEMIQNLAARELANAIIERTVQKNNIAVSDDLILSWTMSRPEFQINGRFDSRILNAYLKHTKLSESEYVQNVRRGIERQILISPMVEGFSLPKVMIDLYEKLAGQKIVVSYITVDADKVKTDREISEDEIEQYYNDFAPDFVEQEKRDADFILLTNDDIAKNIKVSDEEIETYYQDNISNYEQPETRHVLQIMFEDEQSANKAFFNLKSGADFYKTAQEFASQSHDETDFGYVSKDMLIDEVKDEVFALSGNSITKPIESENGWHIMKVEEIVPMVKMPKSEAVADIKAKIKEEKLYDGMYAFISEIEEKIADGASLSQIAENTGSKVEHVSKLSEDGSYDSQSLLPSLEQIVRTPDFVDAVFSYNEGELSQAIETEAGFAIVSVSKIYDARQKSIEEVLPQIKKMWEENERSVIAQETVNDVMHDLEQGDNIYDVAKRFDLKVVTTNPLVRGEASGDLTEADVISLFHEDLFAPKLIAKGNIQTVAVVEKSAVEKIDLTAEGREMLEAQATRLYLTNFADTILHDFARNYDVRVKHRLMGLND